ncbi:MAG: extracellular solute-binding protein [Clostridiaceae bacterium]|nr:extracellular solute-binding protein [Clostridiaceae bacterium]
MHLKLTAILLCVVMILGLAGCAAAPAATTAAGTGTSASSTTKASDMTTTASAADPFGKYDPPVTVTSIRATPNPATVNYLNGDSATSNEWTRLYADRLGINLEYKWMVDSSQWESKLNLEIASGDIPDVFQVSMVQMYQLKEAGLIMDLTDAYDQYASDYTKEIILESGSAQLDSTKIDGKMMALPYCGLPKESGPALMLRDDWLEKLNLKAPETFDDLVAIIKAFVTQDPDGNGQDDTIGLVMDKTLFSAGLNADISLCFHSYPYKWVKDSSGAIAYGGIQPETKALLERMAKMYADGLIDKEFGSKDFTKGIEPIVQGKAGVYIGAFWSPLYPLQALYNNDPTVKIGYYQLPTVDSQPAKIYSPLGTIGYWVVNKNMKNPEAVVKMMNLWNETFYGNKDDEIYNALVNRADGTEVWQNALIQTYRGFKNLDAYYNVSAAYNGKKDTKELTPEERGVLVKAQAFDKGDKTMWAWKEIYGPDGIFKVTDKYVKDNLYVEQPYLGPPTATELESGTTLSDLTSQVFIKIVTGASPIEEFDNYVSQWKANGGDAWTKELNDFMSAR